MKLKYFDTGSLLNSKSRIIISFGTFSTSTKLTSVADGELAT